MSTVATIGAAQARVLARGAPAVDGLRWVVATAAAAGFAWFVGMAGGAILGSDDCLAMRPSRRNQPVLSCARS